MRDASFIAATNPAVVLALLDALDRAEAERGVAYVSRNSIMRERSALASLVTARDATIAGLRGLLGEALSQIRYSRQENGVMRYEDPGLMDRIDAALKDGAE